MSDTITITADIPTENYHHVGLIRDDHERTKTCEIGTIEIVNWFSVTETGSLRFDLLCGCPTESEFKEGTVYQIKVQTSDGLFYADLLIDSDNEIWSGELLDLSND